MTNVVLENINSISDLLTLSQAYMKGVLKLNISKISRELNVDRKTVRKYLNGHIKKETRIRKKYLDDYKEIIINYLDDKYRSFDYIDHLYKFMKREHNITCSRSSFSRYIRTDEELSKKFNRKKEFGFTERFETKPGVQAQFDLKERISIIDKYGNKSEIYIPTLTMGYSRFNFRRVTLNNNTDVNIAFLAEAFEYLGGVPKELVIDNLKPFVTKARYKGQDAILNVKFEEFCKDYGIIVKPCMPARPMTKGKTETQNKIVDQMHNYNGTYTDIISVRETLRIIDTEDNNSISQGTGLPRTFLLEKEKGNLRPLPNKEIRQKYYLTLSEVNVTNESLISYKSCKYSVPKNFIGKKVGLIVQNNELHVYYNKDLIAIHEINDKKINILPVHNLNYERINKLNDDSKSSIIMQEMENINFD